MGFLDLFRTLISSRASFAVSIRTMNAEEKAAVKTFVEVMKKHCHFAWLSVQSDLPGLSTAFNGVYNTTYIFGN